MSETEYYNYFSKLCRITAYVIRFVKNNGTVLKACYSCWFWKS